MDLLSFFDSQLPLLNYLIYSVSQQATKTPLYSILISMLNGTRSGFVSDILTTLQHSLVLGIREGDVMGSILRVFLHLLFNEQYRFFLLLSLLGTVKKESISASITSLLSTIQETNNPILIRMLLSNLLYIHPFESSHQSPLPLSEYIAACDQIHTYLQTTYKSSECYQNTLANQGYLHVVLFFSIQYSHLQSIMTSTFILIMLFRRSHTSSVKPPPTLRNFRSSKLSISTILQCYALLSRCRNNGHKLMAKQFRKENQRRILLEANCSKSIEKVEKCV